ncbi:FemAB family XrtA/PEP-CTERM system-associated protein [Roseiconus lacunae]|uniref:FemAB family XrtA/PEP-CTERM system-associated protein n=1 Tax=Roseiconus lacunae TaxID=2605694 RepID=UPI001E3BCF18|nr:FemAB family XrtA/PEP-CTERM system-associated protein [Roseiconus lacunae]MCD0458858.1 FemAB family PEP-CTERM system-associated protein [Roseiconus lacunae]WRQ49172.1 FemAB family XrtA/PEP-CTERM system-associated protein [Stieleria sp. HD01]
MSSVRVDSWPAEWPNDCPPRELKLAGHDARWLNSICRGLSHRGYLLTHRSSENGTGLLPLVFVKGPLFGKFLVSLPYINTGGVWAGNAGVASELIDAACNLADELNVKYLELRHEQAVEHPRLNFARTDKVHMRLALPETDEELNKSFKSKLRSQIKKSGSYGATVHFGRQELLAEFYNVFAHNMRDLGTPVFSVRLFREILNAFEDDAELCVVRNESQAVAGGLLIHSDGVSEVPSASSLREFNRTGANMWMYRHLLRRAIERGSHTFDFGRSSEDSGTYKFKAQWGAVPSPATWQYYVRQGDPNDMRPDADGKKRLVELWTKLPVSLTRIIGPPIVRGIP